MAFDYLVRRGIGLPEMTRVDLPTRRVRWQWSCPQDVPRPWYDGDHPQRLQLDSCTCIDVATRSASRPFARRQESSHSAGGSGSCGLKSGVGGELVDRQLGCHARIRVTEPIFATRDHVIAAIAARAPPAAPWSIERWRIHANARPKTCGQVPVA